MLIKIKGLKSFIVYRDKKYYLQGEDSLTLDSNDNLHRNEIDDIAEIQYLSKLSHLKCLDLSYNKIPEISCLDHYPYKKKILKLFESNYSLTIKYIIQPIHPDNNTINNHTAAFISLFLASLYTHTANPIAITQKMMSVIIIPNIMGVIITVD